MVECIIWLQFLLVSSPSAIFLGYVLLLWPREPALPLGSIMLPALLSGLLAFTRWERSLTVGLLIAACPSDSTIAMRRMEWLSPRTKMNVPWSRVKSPQFHEKRLACIRWHQPTQWLVSKASPITKPSPDQLTQPLDSCALASDYCFEQLSFGVVCYVTLLCQYVSEMACNKYLLKKKEMYYSDHHNPKEVYRHTCAMKGTNANPHCWC